MCTINSRGLVKSECLIFIFATVFLYFGLCQNAEPRSSSRLDGTSERQSEYREQRFDSATLNERSDSSKWDESQEVAKDRDANVKGLSVTHNGNSEAKTEVPAVRDPIVGDKNEAVSELENRHDDSSGKTGLIAVSTRCNCGCGSKKRSCPNETKFKKRRRYTSLGRGGLTVGEGDISSSNRIRGSSGRSRRIQQERGQTRSKSRGRKKNGRRTRKKENNGRTRSRKNNKLSSRINAEAPAALREASRSELLRNGTKSTTKELVDQETPSSGTKDRPEKAVKNNSSTDGKHDEDSMMMSNLDADNTIPPGITSKPEVINERRDEDMNKYYPKNPEASYEGRKRHEENVEHEFSRNLEKEILWSRTELPVAQDESSMSAGEETNLSSIMLEPRLAEPTFVDSFDTKNAGFDAAKMLGYSRSAEDMPIMDLENDVLTRTLKDYNAYLKNSEKMTKFFRHSPDKDVDSRENNKDKSSRLERPRVRNHEVTKKNDDQRKLQLREEVGAPEATEELANAGTTAAPKGDLTCINGTFIPAPLARHALIKYVKSSIPGHEYLEADYECIPGFYMASLNSRLLCKNRRWIGALPNCKIRRGQYGPCTESPCDQVCNEVDGQAKCSCYKGFRLDGHKCYDINECENENGGCEFECVNTPGSYRCECPQGMKRGENKFTCIDVNECLLNNGHGPCQDTCHNDEGSYTCSCDGLIGTILSSDNHTCQDAGPCAINNAGCSHTCLSTVGRVFCLCPDGFILTDDWKTCQDVDECYVPDLQTEICHYGCINTPGSYRCVDPTELSDQPSRDSLAVTCLPGYTIGTGPNCIDINECAINNGGCSEVCENTEGSFFCACDGDEKALSVDGKSCTDINDLACAPLDPARRGYLMCSRETMPRMWRDDRREANRPGTKCYLKCPMGYQLHGEYELTCQGDGTWDGPKHGECVKYSKPRLECPKDVIAEIPPDRDEAFVTFDQPSTDLDWFRYVRSKPSWGTRLEASLKPGLHLVTFSARHPVSKKQASCVLRILVKEGEAPKVNNCPSNIAAKNGTSVTWPEPTFTDNVRVTHTSNNESPGKVFGFGEWKIVYEASDEAGWTTRCVFVVEVHQD